MQKEVFLDQEADRWFERNKDKNIINANVKDFVEKYINKGNKVLEIGCADGKYLNYIERSKMADCYGLDPSYEAIQKGSNAYPNLNLKVGTADMLEFEDEYFDVVYFGFCLYLIDVENLSKVVFEADRVLKNGGMLAILDFDAKIPKVREYRHCKGVNTHKCDYYKIFESFPFYHLVEKKSFSQAEDKFSYQPSERISFSILYKDYNNAYVFEAD